MARKIEELPVGSRAWWTLMESYRDNCQNGIQCPDLFHAGELGHSISVLHVAVNNMGHQSDTLP